MRRSFQQGSVSAQQQISDLPVAPRIPAGRANFGVRWQAQRDTALDCRGAVFGQRQSAVADSLCRRAPKDRSRRSQRGIALVVTLIMLAVVTVMAIVFLGISRRERTSVTVTADLTDSELMADAALARAQAEIIARIAARSNLFAYDLLVSTNFIQRSGFRPGVSSLTNVSYVDTSLQPLSSLDDIRQNLTNLFYDPRPPVFIVTNSITGQSDFRFYLDLNRNGRFDDTDYEPWKRGPRSGTNGVGDPQWIGVLEHPDQPHSPSNRFVGRYAFVVSPVGKTLDVNYFFNSVRTAGTVPLTGGYSRSQGVGSWELNLPAFLHDLNSNAYAWGNYTYDQGAGIASGEAFDDALSILKYRYASNLLTLDTVSQLFGSRGATVFQNDQIDGYSDGPFFTGIVPPPESVAPDVPTRPWPGSDNTNGYAAVEELLDGAKTSVLFTNRLRTVLNDTLDPYNYNTFSRVLSQLGTDSAPANKNKLNLNYVNVDTNTGVIVPQLAANFEPWRPILFFTNAGNLLLQRQFGPDVPINRIPLWPTNYYTASVHRLLQLTANICDSMTNRLALTATSATNLYAPSVFRPLISRQSTNVFIIGFQEVTNNALLTLTRPWVDLNDLTSRNSIAEGMTNDVNVYGLPWVIGARKGFPNFNEYYCQTSVQVTRRIQAEKSSPTAEPIFRPAYLLGISNYFGAEAWNSYTNAYPGALRLILTNRSAIQLNEGTNPPIALRPPWLVSAPYAPYVVSTGVTTNITAGAWLGEQFQTPLANQVIFLPDLQYYFNKSPPNRFDVPRNTNITWETTRVPYPVPDWKLYVTNRFMFALLSTDTPGGERLIDFVNLDNLNGSIDITRHLFGRTNLSEATNLAGLFWLTNRHPINQMTWGISNQILASLTNLLSEDDWKNLSFGTAQSREVEIDGFRQFLGLPPLFNPTNEAARGPRVMVPFTPSRKLDLKMQWQVNDPLVHYHVEDLYDPMKTNPDDVDVLKPHASPSKSSNLGLLNYGRYQPWGGQPGSAVQDFTVARQDPLIRRSDDWAFPSNAFPNLGWLGRVHRGTPWQTVYLKSAALPVTEWRNWAGRDDTHPTNDWWILDLFTTAANDNAARGLLSVNQTNLAAWSAVLSEVSVLTNLSSAGPGGGVPVYGNLFIQPGSPQLHTIVSNINLTRLQQPNQTFLRMGQVLAAPALTVASPFLNTANPGIDDAAIERIPQQILSLLKEDEPRVVIYAFGQSLKPADRSIVTAPGVYQNLCTNYQITGEVATKTMVRFLELRQQGSTYYRAVVESYNVLPND